MTARVHPRGHQRDGAPLGVFLFRLIGLCLLPLFVLATWLTYDSLRAGQVRRDDRAARHAKNSAAAVDRHLDARIRALHLLAVSPLADHRGRKGSRCWSSARRTW